MKRNISSTSVLIPHKFQQRSVQSSGFLSSQISMKDLSLSDQVENRIECLHRLVSIAGLPSDDREFIKRVLFVGKYDLKEVIESVINLLPERFISYEPDLFDKCCGNDWIDSYAL